MVDIDQPLKVIKQIGYNILLEEGDKIFVAIFTINEFQIIHDKMQYFLNEFEDQFHDSLMRDDREITLYNSAEELVDKYFR